MDKPSNAVHSKAMKLVLLTPLATLAACSFTASSVPLDANNDDALSDAARNVDAPSDASSDAMGDAAHDAARDAMVDAAHDAARDAMPDAAAMLRTWVQDTEADFAPGLSTGSVVTPWNTVEPQAFAPGWILRGKAGAAFSDENALDFASLDNPTDRSLATSIAFQQSFQAPAWISNVTDPFTVWAEGQLFLGMGQHQFRATCDDRGVFAVKLTNDFAKVVSCNYTNGTQTGSIDVPTTGWYPIRFAWTDNLLGASFLMDHRKPSSAGFVAIASDEMRSDVTLEANANQLGFDQIGMLGLTGSRLWSRSVAEENFGTSASPNLGITQNTRWSSRWVGQVRLEAAGAYSFAVNSTDGHRLIIDGERLADTAIGAPGATTTAPRQLTAGWHDLALDLHVNTPSNAAPATLSLKPVANAPEFAGVALPNARFRPVVTGTERLFTAQDNSQVNVPNNSTLVRTITTSGVPTDAIVTGIDLSYRAVPSNGRTINVSLIDPGGVAVSVGNGGSNSVVLALADFNTRAAAGAWKLSIDNTGNNRQAQVTNFAITLHYKTLAQPAIATTASYQSSQHDFAVPVTLTSITWLERQAAGGAIAISVRACAAACSNEPYVAVSQNGMAPVGVIGRFVQYRASFTSNGITVPALDKITIVGAE